MLDIKLHQRPQVLILSGLDPSGGAGIQADIQTVTALGGHPLPIVTCLTVQDTRNVYSATAVEAELVAEQLACLAEDTPIHAIKTGALGNSAIVDVLLAFISNHPGIPLIVDPVIKAAGGGDLADQSLIASMRDKLFPHADVITPNGVELVALGRSADAGIAASALLQSGCHAVLATGGHGSGPDLTNTLFRTHSEPVEWIIERIGADYEGEFHGTGCTLAAAIAAGRAAGLELDTAIEQAQHFVSAAIAGALEVGGGQPVPDRISRPQPQ
ncbi:MAG: hydroxymethylpyrimidine/phosphomethylpyrimidine kinase [Marinobacter sp.]|uniref:hydroxymethylpyrimidine/phosphomethylpyrimidine kinase n=1 Tax=Marinobacter sp. TaxID=50741 RepID=UPI0034A0582E